jgi:predicted protein tyrosine phosphatase
MLTICGIEELTLHGSRGVTHVLSILDPDQPDPEAFRAYDRHHRQVLRFHDVIQPTPGLVLPTPDNVRAVLEFGDNLIQAAAGTEAHLLVHCHAGISRSTAAMAMLLAQADPSQSEEAILERLLALRPKAWPNSLMLGFADEILGRRFGPELGKLYRRQLAAYPHVREFMRDNGREKEVALADAA